jgi:nicotinate-nucleotide adenylyltransferase
VTAQRICLFGGTFDPIHIGHLILAEEARFHLGLDRVYLAPVGDPPHKQERKLTPVVHRLQMVELAIADMAGLWLWPSGRFTRVSGFYSLHVLQLA